MARKWSLLQEFKWVLKKAAPAPGWMLVLWSWTVALVHIFIGNGLLKIESRGCVGSWDGQLGNAESDPPFQDSHGIAHTQLFCSQGIPEAAVTTRCWKQMPVHWKKWRATDPCELLMWRQTQWKWWHEFWAPWAGKCMHRPISNWCWFWNLLSNGWPSPSFLRAQFSTIQYQFDLSPWTSVHEPVIFMTENWSEILQWRPNSPTRT